MYKRIETILSRKSLAGTLSRRSNGRRELISISTVGRILQHISQGFYTQGSRTEKCTQGNRQQQQAITFRALFPWTLSLATTLKAPLPCLNKVFINSWCTYLENLIFWRQSNEFITPYTVGPATTNPSCIWRDFAAPAAAAAAQTHSPGERCRAIGSRNRLDTLLSSMKDFAFAMLCICFLFLYLSYFLYYALRSSMRYKR